MCLADAPQQPKQPDPPAPAPSPADAIEPELAVKRGKPRSQSIMGKRRYRVDLNKPYSTQAKASYSGNGLNIPT